MKAALNKEERLIVAADFEPEAPNGRKWVRERVLWLAGELAGTGVYLKVNSALRACGYGLIDDIHDRGLRVFADLKLFDIPNTLKTDGALLLEANPEIITVVCAAGEKAMRAIALALPKTEVLGVTVLTSMNNEDTEEIYRDPVSSTVMRLAHIANRSCISGLIASPDEAHMLTKQSFGVRFSINTPAIRPLWHAVVSDDQNLDRVMTPKKAILAGADRVIIGRPILQASDLKDAVRRTLDEIESALNELHPNRSPDGCGLIE